MWLFLYQTNKKWEVVTWTRRWYCKITISCRLIRRLFDAFDSFTQYSCEPSAVFLSPFAFALQLLLQYILWVLLHFFLFFVLVISYWIDNITHPKDCNIIILRLIIVNFDLCVEQLRVISLSCQHPSCVQFININLACTYILYSPMTVFKNTLSAEPSGW